MSKLFVETKDGDRFKSITCSRSADWWTSLSRHLAPVGEDNQTLGWTTTLCGSTGTREAFHGARTRPLCGDCLKKFEKLGGTVEDWLK